MWVGKSFFRGRANEKRDSKRIPRRRFLDGAVIGWFQCSVVIIIVVMAVALVKICPGHVPIFPYPLFVSTAPVCLFLLTNPPTRIAPLPGFPLFLPVTPN